MSAAEAIFRKLARDERGATAVEYGLIVAGISVVILVVVFLLGNKVNNALNKAAAGMH